MEEIFLKEGEQGFDERPIAFLVTGGSIFSPIGGKNEDDFYLEYVEKREDWEQMDWNSSNKSKG